jgi:predicted RNase H-like nuclease (RuvC/YqgF family)
MQVKAELERVRLIAHDNKQALYAAKAEVERLGTENAHLHKGIYSLSLNVVQLKDEVERLTKAGDAMKFDCLDYLRELEKRPFWFPLLSELEVNHKSVQAWNAAKEGKQP